jgi:capsule polysaccharide export protein KpsE/RkpR
MQDPAQTSKPKVAPIEGQILAETLSEEVEILAARERRVARLRLLWNERRFLLRCILVGLLAAILIAFVIPKQYESTAQLMPPDSQSTSNLALLGGLSGSSGGGLALLAGDLLGLKSNGALFTGVLRSRTVQDRIVDRFGLKKVYGKRLQIEARQKLADRTAITEDRKSGIITITVTDHDPKRATAIASAYVDELNVLIAQLSTSSARRERIFLEDRLSSVKQDLEAAENDFSRFASTKGTVDISEQGKAIVEAAATLEGELIAAQSQLEGLKQIYSDQNVRVRSAQARIDSLRDQMRKLSGNADSSIDGIEKVSDPYPTLRQLPILGVPYADKMRRLKVEEVVFETLTKQYELAKVEEAKEIPSVKELDTPVVPEHKSFPPRLFIMLSGTLCGAMLGMFWVLAQARWQEIDPQDPGKALAREVFEKLAARIPNAVEEKLQGNARHVEGGQAGSSKGATEGQSD